MVALVKTFAFQGMDAVLVDVQVHLAPGQHAFAVVGLADKSIAESRERVRAALHVAGLALPFERITINLSPADLPKEGSHYDLAIALGLLVSMGVLAQDQLDGFVVMGELGLDGSCRGVPGCLPAAVAAHALGMGLVCPQANGGEAALAGMPRALPGIIAPPHLLALIDHLRGRHLLPDPTPLALDDAGALPDMADVRGQGEARLVLEVAAAGEHNILMIGPPGAGKSMIASRLPSLLPLMTPTEALEVNMIASLARNGAVEKLSRRRPYRAPHHSASMAALVGGGRSARPGEISLAHNGVLFLDELPEFPRNVLDSLRQPIETGHVHIARAALHITYPARFQLIAAMNPCRCGYADDPARACPRVPQCRRDYVSSVSGPLLDRFDMVLHVPPAPLIDMISPDQGESSASISRRVQQARARQQQRQGCLNKDLSGDALMKHIQLHPDAQRLLDHVVAKNQLSARGFARLLRVARSITDLADQDQITASAVATALNWRHGSLLGEEIS
jgi:magnesium chelatase family protein